MNKIEQIFSFLDVKFPDSKCELNYRKDYELLIAVMLSAQTTDKAVNKVTEVLFDRYPSLEELSKAEISDVEKIIHSVGLSKTKAVNVVSIANELITRFNSIVPSSREELMSLNGVGRKTANVVRIEYFKIPEIPVDTHVERVSKRLTLAKDTDSTLDVELKLKRKLPKERLIKAHHQLIFFGRYMCKSQSPICEDCPFKDFCRYQKKLSVKR
jgi:endonuclease-3